MKRCVTACALFALGAAAVGLAGCSGSEQPSSRERPSRDQATSLAALDAAARKLEPACEALTLEGARGLLGSDALEFAWEVGDMCVYEAPGGEYVAFELMAPFGEFLYRQDKSENRTRDSEKTVGEDAFFATDGEAVVLSSFQGDVYLRLKVEPAGGDELRKRMSAFAAAALTGY